MKKEKKCKNYSQKCNILNHANSVVFFMQKLKNFILPKIIGFYINILSFVYPKKSLELAYQFFSNPRLGKLSADNLPDILKEASLAVIEYDHHYFQTYTWLGNENKILLVHGWESNASRWEKLIPYLQKTGCTIIAIDAPAHGLSSGTEFDIPTYAAFINMASKIHKPKYIIGHSIGGSACTYYQYHYKSDDLEKMILLGSPSEFKVLLHNYMKLLSLNTMVYQGLIKFIKHRFSIDIEEFSGAKFLRNTSIQGIIAHDINDSVVAFEEGQKMAKSWKKAAFIETENLGHSMHDDELYQKILEFIASD
jgi:predicted alpha/beta hydrolase family esterase